MVSLDVRSIAAICHETNRAYCATIGDLSQQRWQDAPEWQQISAVKGVEFVIANPGSPPSASHDSWLDEKRRTGWRFGEVKNPETKEHPCFVPYDELPANQRRKDRLFGAVVRAMILPE
jgi:hypothetical protein